MAIARGLGRLYEEGGTRGFRLHASLAVTPARTPLGVLRAETWARSKPSASPPSPHRGSRRVGPRSGRAACCGARLTTTTSSGRGSVPDRCPGVRFARPAEVAIRPPHENAGVRTRAGPSARDLRGRRRARPPGSSRRAVRAKWPSFAYAPMTFGRDYGSEHSRDMVVRCAGGQRSAGARIQSWRRTPREPRGHRFLLATCAVAACGLVSATSRADPTKDQCVDAHAKAQDLRRSSNFSAARDQLRQCSSAPSCPALIRDDCTKRLDELEGAQPTLVFEVKDAAGNDLSAVKVTIDGALLTERLGGTALSVDPGEHTFTFEAGGLTPLTRKLIIREAQKDRRESITLAALVARRLELRSCRKFRRSRLLPRSHRPNRVWARKSPWPSWQVEWAWWASCSAPLSVRSRSRRRARRRALAPAHLAALKRAQTSGAMPRPPGTSRLPPLSLEAWRLRAASSSGSRPNRRKVRPALRSALGRGPSW